MVQIGCQFNHFPSQTPLLLQERVFASSSHDVSRYGIYLLRLFHQSHRTYSFLTYFPTTHVVSKLEVSHYDSSQIQNPNSHARFVSLYYSKIPTCIDVVDILPKFHVKVVL